MFRSLGKPSFQVLSRQFTLGFQSEFRCADLRATIFKLRGIVRNSAELRATIFKLRGIVRNSAELRKVFVVSQITPEFKLKKVFIRKSHEILNFMIYEKQQSKAIEKEHKMK